MREGNVPEVYSSECVLEVCTGGYFAKCFDVCVREVPVGCVLLNACWVCVKGERVKGGGCRDG